MKPEIFSEIGPLEKVFVYSPGEEHNLVSPLNIQPFILKDRSLRSDLQEHLETCGIETRPLCSGNLLRQPFLSEYEPFKEFPKVDYLHYHGFFIGNNHLIADDEIQKLGFILDDYLRVL